MRGTPAAPGTVDVRPADIVEIALDGSAPRRRGDRSGPRASTEVGLRPWIHARRPDIAAAVHAHPPTATGFGVAAEDFMAPILPEIIFQVGGVPLVRYAAPGTMGVADASEPYLDRHDAFLMANHGGTTVGASPRLVRQRTESLELVARIDLAARTLERVRPRSDADVAALHDLRATMPPRTPTTGSRRTSR